jgi:hypothetical protein
MIESFTRQETEAVDRLMRDSDFIVLVEFIKRNCTNLALAACQISGLESEKIKGGSLVLQEVRDAILFSKDVIKRYREEDQLPPLSRDTISP